MNSFYVAFDKVGLDKTGTFWIDEENDLLRVKGEDVWALEYNKEDGFFWDTLTITPEEIVQDFRIGVGLDETVKYHSFRFKDELMEVFEEASVKSDV